MNQYPLWKYLVVLGVFLLGLIYSIPNFYPPNPAVQISPASSNVILDKTLQDKLVAALEKADMKPIKVDMTQAKQLTIHFDSTDTQLKAQEVINRELLNGYIIALNLAPTTPAWLRAIGAAPINYGLDLRGGVHFLMEVDVKGALGKMMQRREDEIRTVLRNKKIYYESVTLVNPQEIKLIFAEAKLRDQAREALKNDYKNMDFDTGEQDGKWVMTLKLNDSGLIESTNFAVDQNITTLRNRVNALGVAEPVIQRQGANRIVVELPGVQDTTQAKDILSATATLEFRMADQEGDVAAAVAGRIPPGSRLYYERDGKPILLKSRVIVTGDHITNAQSGIESQNGSPAVFISLDSASGKQMQNTTRENVGKPMAVVFLENRKITRMQDGKPVIENGKLVKDSKLVQEVINVAVIREQFASQFQISGLDSFEEAGKLALLLRAGALAAPIDIIEERTVGPSLGQENINKGVTSILVAFALVVVLMLVYYRVFGIFANVALLANIVLITAILSILGIMFQASLSLPGIAGIVLTMGMAVDANVLINERIREELRNGNSIQASIHAGYERAFATIADSNITTLIAGLVLAAVGTGPVRGFAITLSIGILTSMFTAVMGTRALVNLVYGGRKINRLSI